MHLGNSIICPVTGIPMIAVMGAVAFYAFKKAKKEFKKERIMPFVLLSAFVFALQMINFSIPSLPMSGHIIGGILLCALLGPYLGFLSMALILIVQAFLFSDGGIMALGCNIFNMGFLSCFVAYPLLYKPLEKMNKKGLGMVLSSMFALQLGSIMITIEALLSGSIQGNYMSFIYSMTSIHLVLGIIEGGFTSIVYMLKDKKYFLSSVGIVSLLLSGVIANYASNKPDGLEWSLLNLNDSFNAQTQSSLYMLFEMLQAKTSVLFSLDNSYANILGVFAVAILSYLSSITLKSNHNNI